MVEPGGSRRLRGLTETPAPPKLCSASVRAKAIRRDLGGRFMKLKVLLVGLAAAMLSVSAAVGAPPPGKGKPLTGAGCKPKVMVVLKGKLTGTPLSVDVTSANRWGRAYVEGTASMSIAVDPNTKVRRQGKAEIDDLEVDDRVLVQAKVCKLDLKDDAKPSLTAWKVVAHPAKAEAEDDD
jgi:hypothetical protein